ncbi:unnamed protein product [Chrysoparadoxa australica]
MAVADNYQLSVVMSVDHGVLSVAGAVSVTFSAGDGKEDEMMLFHGSAAAASAALGSITYRPHPNWFGTATITITVNDQMYLGAGEALSDTKQITVLVTAVPDLPTVIVPAAAVTAEDQLLDIHGISLYDADAAGPGGDELLFSVTLSVFGGGLTLGSYEGLDLAAGTVAGRSDPVISATGSLSALNRGLSVLHYTPFADFNANQHTEILSITVQQVASEEPELVLAAVTWHVITIAGPAVAVVAALASASLQYIRNPRWNGGGTIELAVALTGLEEEEQRYSFNQGDGSEARELPAIEDVSLIGAEVAVTGSNFNWFGERHPAHCQLAGVVVEASVISDTELTCELPAVQDPDLLPLSITPRFVPVRLTDASTTWTNAAHLWLEEPMRPLVVVPSSGTICGGTMLQVTCSGLLPSEGLRCDFEDAQGRSTITKATYISPTTVECQSQPWDSANAELQLWLASDTTGRTEHSVTYTLQDPPVVSGVLPALGPATGGTLLTITGENFVNEEMHCVFSGRRQPATVLTTQALTCTVPSRIATGVEVFSTLLHSLNDTFLDATQDGSTRVDGGIELHLVRGREYWFMTGLAGPLIIMDEGGTTPISAGVKQQASSFFGNIFPLIPFPPIQATSYTVPADAPDRLSATLAGQEEAPGKLLLLITDDMAVTYVSVTGTGGSACSANELSFRYTSVHAHSISPSIATLGSELTVRVSGEGFEDNTDLACRFGDIGTSRAHYISSTEVECNAPVVAAAAVVPVQVTVNSVDFTAEYLAFMFAEGPIITSLEPASGPLLGGNSVVVRGQSFVDAGQDGLGCKFGDTLVMAQLLSDTAVLCIAPAAEVAGTVAVEVTLNGLEFSASGMLFEYYEDPVVSELLPSSGAVSGGTGITVKGSGFRSSPNLAVRFGLIDVPATFLSSTELHCEAPPSVQGPVAVSVTSNGAYFTASEVDFEYVNVVTVTAVEPLQGSVVGGTLVTVRGSGFLDSNGLSCSFGAVGTVDAVYISESEISCEAPAAPAAGQVAVEVTVNGVDYTHHGYQFTYLDLMLVESMSPARGPITGGSQVQVRGANFSDSDSWSCGFGSEVVPAQWVSTDLVQCSSPGAISEGGVTLRVGLGGEWLEELDQAFDYYREPALLGVLTARYQLARTQHNVPRGRLHTTQPSPSPGRFGEAEAVDAVFVSTEEIICSTPAASSARVVAVEVTLNGVDYSSDGVELALVPLPSVSALAAVKGPQAGGTLVELDVEGMADQEGIGCRFGDLSVPARWLEHGRLLCVSPAAEVAGTVAVEVTLNGLEFSASGMLFEYYEDPVVSELLPSSGAVSGGTGITVRGSGFRSSPSLAVRFGLIDVPATFLSSTELHCEAPPSVQGPVAVSVTSDGAYFSASELHFEYVDVVTLTAVEPLQGSVVGGTLVTVQGSGFLDSNKLSCSFGAVGTVDAVYISESEISCEAPAAPAAGQVAVGVSMNGADLASGAVQFTYIRDALVLSVTPTSGPVSGGTNILVEGAHFMNSGSLSCSFGGVVAKGHWVSDSLMRCESPSVSSATPLELEVSVNGLDFTSSGIMFDFYSDATAQSLEPASGASSGGTQVTLYGSGFRLGADLTVRFGLIDVPVTYVSSTELLCESPPATPGSVALAVSNNGVDFAAAQVEYQYIDAISVTLVEPSLGSTKGGTAVTVRGSGFQDDPNLACFFGESGCVDAMYISETEVTCTTPEAAGEAGAVPFGVSVNGADVALSYQRFEYMADPSFLSVTPTSGPLQGGTAVSLTGEGFVDSDALGCRFGEEEAPAVWVSSSLVMCRVPAAQAAGTIPVELTLNGHGYYSDGMLFTYYPEPVLLELSPSLGLATGGSEIKITGEGFHFSPNLTARFGQTDVPAVYYSATEVICETPPASPGVVAVSVSSNGADFPASSLEFAFEAGAQLEAVSPSQGSVSGGMKVSIYGYGFLDNAELSCSFGAAGTVAGVYVSESEITCVTPAAEGAGAVIVGVSMNRASLASGVAKFSYIGDASVLSITPTSGPMSGGTDVLVEGANFVDSDNLSCSFGGLIAAGRWISEHAIRCSSPSVSSAQTVDLLVTLNGVEFAPASASFSYYENPVVQSMEPASGPSTGGTPLTITGTGFRWSPSLTVRFGLSEVPAAFLSSTSIACVTPAGLVGPAAVSVTLNSADLSPADELDGTQQQFIYTAHATVSSVVPAATSMLGGRLVRVYGSGFSISDGLACHFGDAPPVPAMLITESELTCTAPAAAAAGLVQLAVSLDGTTLSTEKMEFAYLQIPVVDRLSPSEASADAESAVRVWGEGFGEEEAWECIFGSAHMAGYWVSSAAVECIAPPHASSEEATVPFELAVNGFTVGTTGVDFTYTCSAGSTIEPTSGSSAGGTVVTVTGSNFDSSRSWHCWFGDEAVPALALRDSTLQCVSPRATGLPLRVSFSVSRSDSTPGSCGTDLWFDYTSDLVVESAWPLSGSVEGGTAVVITLAGPVAEQPPVNCLFGDMVCHYCNLVLLTPILLNTPQTPAWSSRGTVLLSVIKAGHHTPTAFSTPFRFLPPLVVVGADPSIGATDLSQSSALAVRVSGFNFISSEHLSCRFGKHVVEAQWLSRSLIDCQAGEVEPGTYQVEVSNNKADWITSEVHFTVVPRPSVIHLSPDSGPTTGGTKLIIEGAGFSVDLPVLTCIVGGHVSEARVIDANHILCVTGPNAAGIETVQVCDANGTCASGSSPLSFAFVEMASLAAVTPAVGSINGGTTITLAGDQPCGSHMDEAVCRFGATVTPATITPEGHTTCVTPPAQSPGATAVTLSCNGQDFAPTEASFSYLARAILHSTSHTAISASGGEQLQLHGRSFSSHRSTAEADWGPWCLFGSSTHVKGQWLSETQMSCAAPALPPGRVPVRIGNTLGDWSEQALEVSLAQAPFTPTAGPLQGGTIITVMGTSIQTTGSDSATCRFGHTTVPARLHPPSTIECAAPPATEAGSVQVSVSLGGANFAPLEGTFTYEHALQLIQVHPSVGGSTGMLTISVAEDASASAVLHQGGIMCRFGDSGNETEATVGADSLSVLCTVPNLLPREVSISLWSAGQQVSSGDVALNVQQSPIVASIQPRVGLTTGGSWVTVMGRYLTPLPQLQCWFGEVLATEMVWVSSEQVMCKTPPGTPGDVSVSATYEGGEPKHLSSYSQYTYLMPPEVVEIEPQQGPAYGGTVVKVSGQGLSSRLSPQCCFGLGETCSPAVQMSESGLELQCITPHQRPGILPFRLRVADGSYIDPQVAFTFEAGGAAIENVHPTAGPYHGGFTVIISGQGFSNSHEYSCSFQGANVNQQVLALWVNLDQLQCIAPSWPKEEIVSLQVVSERGDVIYGSASPVIQFTYYRPPAVSAVTPRSGSELGGGRILVSGAFFKVPAFHRTFPSSTSTSSFSHANHPLFRWLSSTTVSCETPRHQPSSCHVEVTLNGQDYTTNGVAYAFTGSPQLIDISPASGAAGTLVVVTGTSLGQESSLLLTCSFGNVVVPASYRGANELWCKAPPSLPSTVPFALLSGGQPVPGVQPTFTYVAPPKQLLLSPGYGTVLQGTRIALEGLTFALDLSEADGGSGLMCYFNGVSAPLVQQSLGTAECTVPELSMPGEYTVTLRDADGLVQYTSSEPFTALPQHQVVSAYPTYGSVLGGEVVVVQGMGFSNVEHLCCRFGTTTAPAVWKTAEAISCVAPPSESGPSVVALEVSVNCVDFQKSEGSSLEFEYKPAVSLLGIEPARGSCTSPASPSGKAGQAEVMLTDLMGASPYAYGAGLPFDFLLGGATLTGISHASGPSSGGTAVALLGSGLEEATCIFSGREAKVAASLPLALALSYQLGIKCSTSPEWQHPELVTLTVSCRQTIALCTFTFSYYQQPFISSISPATGIETRNTDIRISCMPLRMDLELACRRVHHSGIGLTYCVAEWISTSEMSCLAPVMPLGTVEVQVALNGVDYTDQVDMLYTVLSTPTLLGISPQVGYALGGTQVMVKGTSFMRSGRLVCYFGGVAADTVHLDPNHLLCTSPPSPGGTASQVELSLRLDGWELPYTAGFTYLPTPVMRGLSPVSGPLSGGAAVVVEGQGFAGSQEVFCRFGDDITVATFVSEHLVKCWPPPHEEGAVTVSISTDGSTFTEETASLSYRLHSGSLRYTGPITAQPATIIACTVPGLPTGSTPSSEEVSELVEVSNNGATFVGSGVSFTYHGEPSVMPTHGPFYGGTTVTVIGSNLLPQAGVVCSFGTAMVPASMLDPSTAICSSPAGIDSGAAMPFSLGYPELPWYDSSPQGLTFMYAADAVVISAQPRVLLTEEEAPKITVRGTGFMESDLLSCKLGMFAPVAAKFISAQEVICNPSNAINAAPGVVELAISNNGQDWSKTTTEVTIAASPVITNVYPVEGDFQGGTEVSVEGLNLLNTPGLACRFGEAELPVQRWVSDMLLVCQAPPAAAAAEVPLALTLNGVQYTPDGYTFRYTAQHALAAAEPASGPVLGGTLVTIRGTNFRQTNALACRFGGFDVVPAVYVDDNSVQCTSPEHAAGVVAVEVTLNGADYSSGQGVTFTYSSLPSVASIWPASGSEDGGSVVTLSGSNFDALQSYRCLFGSVDSGPAQQTSASTMVCVTPPHPVSSVTLQLMDNAGRAAEGPAFRYRFLPTPVLLSVEMSRVLLSGANFVNTATLSCCWDRKCFSGARWLSPDLVSCDLPEQDDAEPPQLVGLSINGMDLTEEIELPRQAMSLEAIAVSPSHGSVHGGTRVSVIWLGNAPEVAQIWCSPLVALASFASPPISHTTGLGMLPFPGCWIHPLCLLTYALRRLAAGRVDVAISLDGSLYGPSAVAATYTFLAPFSPTSCQPAAGSRAGGTTINLLIDMATTNDALEPACKFADKRFFVVVEGQVQPHGAITCVTPAWPYIAGTAEVLLSLNGGADFSAGSVSFYFFDEPVVSAVAPRAVLEAGNGFQRRLSVTQRLLSCCTSLCLMSRQLISSLFMLNVHIHPVLSSHLLICSVGVTVNGVDAVPSPATLEYAPVPQTLAVVPDEGPTSGGTLLTILGTHFDYPGTLTCRFGDAVVPASPRDANTVLCRSPPSLDVRIKNFDGLRPLHYIYTYVEAPALGGVQPAWSWSSGGAVVEVSAASLCTASLFYAFTSHHNQLVPKVIPTHNTTRVCMWEALKDHTLFTDCAAVDSLGLGSCHEHWS